MTNTLHFTRLFSLLAFACCVFCSMVRIAHAQPCSAGFVGSQPLLGVNGTIRAMRWWDSDGAAGPLPARLVVAGNFTIAGDVRTNNIAAWDGSRWLALDEGVGTPSESVYALEEFQGELYAAGILSTASGANVRGIARFDGTTWRDVAGGLWLDPVGARVYTLRVHNGALHAAGLIAVAGSASVRNVARFDGTAWSALDRGLDGAVYTLHVHQNQLYAGGSFADSGDLFICPRIARWNGSNWESPTQSTTQLNIPGAIIYALATHNNQLVAGGSCTPLAHLFTLAQDAWQPLIGGVGGASSVSVRALHASADALFVSGNFETANAVPAAGIALLQGSSWSALSTGSDGTLLALASATPANTNPSSIIAAGSFVDTLGSTPVGRIGVWNGVRWSALGAGFSDAVFAQAQFQGAAVIGGAFRHAGSTPANAIARWDGAVWSPFSQGITNAGAAGQVRCLLTSADGASLFAGGGFTQAGGTSANNIAKWNGAAWQNLGTGTNGPVLALANFQGSLIAGGSFTTAGGQSTARIARWNGFSWQPMGAGFSGAGTVSVNALAIYNNELYAAGQFASSGAVAVAGIAKWNAASQTWEPVGSGVSGAANNAVLTMTNFDGELVIGGSFTNAGGASDTTALAKWNGARWARVGPELSGLATNQVTALAATGDTLYVAGLFAFGGSRPLNNFASFSAATGWVALADGLAGMTSLATARTLMPFQGEMLIGGDFTASAPYVSNNIAPGSLIRAYWTRYSPTGTPWTTASALPSTAPACDSEVILNARLATGYGATPGSNWRWAFNGAALQDSARVQGATSPSLRISQVQASDSGFYTCVATTACGEVVHALPIELSVLCNAACDSIDFNNDTLFPDDTDLIEFLGALAGNPCPACNDIDFNNDGLFPDDNDLIAFLRVLAGGTC